MTNSFGYPSCRECGCSDIGSEKKTCHQKTGDVCSHILSISQNDIKLSLKIFLAYSLKISFLYIASVLAKIILLEKYVTCARMAFTIILFVRIVAALS